MIVLRSIAAVLCALALVDCGGLHACTTDGVPCEEAALHPRPLPASSGAHAAPAPLFPTATAAANAPFVPPPMPEAAPEPAPEAPPPTPTATVTDTTAAPPAEEEDTGRHHGRHGRHGHHGGGHHGGGHSRHHRH